MSNKKTAEKDTDIEEEETRQVEEDSQIVAPSSSNSKNPLFNFFVQFAIVAILFFAIGFTAGNKKFQVDQKNAIPQINVLNQTPPGNVQNIDFSLFWQVLQTLPQKYIDKSKIDGNKILYGAISGMVQSLGDPYTVFLDPKQNQAMGDQLSGQYSGVGIQIGFDKENRLSVIAPLKGTPADRAGVLPKDLIIKIDGKDTYNMTLPAAVDLIRGPAGTKIKIVLAREGVDQPIEKDLERAQITIKSVEVTYRQSLSSNKDTKAGKIAVMQVTQFGDKTDSEWDSAVTDVLNQNVKGIVVDMRNNPGGLLTGAIHLASDFVGGTVVKQQFADDSIKELAADHSGRLSNIPLVVLINGGSASAAEIFSGAMQDDKRGKLVGVTSFGKGTVQDVIDLPGGSGLHVTIAKWLTPDGHSIHGVGITPDIKVDMTQDDRDKGRDPQLDKALTLF